MCERRLTAPTAIRTEAVKALFVRFGYEDGDAFVRARVLYYMQIGYYALDLREPIEARLNLTPHYLKAFTGVDPSASGNRRVPRLRHGLRAYSGFRALARAAMSARYSAFALLRQGFAGHKGWPQAWRKAKPKPAYDFVIVGGGGHGLATAYYLAKTHKRTRVCVIEKGWLGGGNTGRNTTIVRSNYFYPESVALYDLALRLYEGLSRELNFNVMLSQRGILNLAHTPAQLEMAARLTNAMQLNGVDAELWGPNEVRERLPLMTQSLDSRYLPNGGVWQKRGGIARHDARRLGLCARRRPARRRHRRELRGDRLHHAERRLRRRRDDVGRNSRRARSASRSPAIRRSSWPRPA